MFVFCSKCQKQLPSDVRTCLCGGETVTIFMPGEKATKQIEGFIQERRKSPGDERHQLHEAVEEARERNRKTIEEAQERARKTIEEAQRQYREVVEDAQQRLRKATEDVQEKVSERDEDGRPLRGRDVGAMLGAHLFPGFANTASVLGHLIGRAMEGQPLIAFRAAPELPGRLELAPGLQSPKKRTKRKSSKRKRKS